MVQLSKKQNENFAESFIQRYLEHGFATMPKRELDLLVFHLLSQTSEFKGKSNYELANMLRITESRVKSLKLEVAIKYQTTNTKAVLGDIVDALVKEMKKPDFSDGVVTISLEDPVYKREFEQAVKKSGYYVEYGINRELLKVQPMHLLDVMLDNIENAENEFIALVKKHISEKAKQQAIIDKSLSLSQRINKLRGEVEGKHAWIALLSDMRKKLAI